MSTDPSRHHRRSPTVAAMDSIIAALRDVSRAEAHAYRARQFEVGCQLEHVSRQLIAQHEHLANALPALRTQSYADAREYRDAIRKLENR